MRLTFSDLNFSNSVVDENGISPMTANGVRFDRGMDIASDQGYVDPEISSPIWDNYLENYSGPSSFGSESELGVHISEGDLLKYPNMKINFSTGAFRMWVRSDWDYTNPGTSRQHLITWGNEPWLNDFQLFVEKKQKMYARITINGVSTVISHDIDYWKSNEWHLVEVLLRDNDTMRLLVDGVFKGTVSINGDPTHVLGSVVSDLVVGGSANRNWNGVIDKLVME